MTRKEQEALILHAFDGGSDSRFQAELNSEAQAELDLLRQMKADLGLLRDVPECQISVESMRDSVLRHEMGSRRRLTPWWAWTIPASAGVAACLIWAGLMLNTPGRSKVEPGRGFVASAIAPEVDWTALSTETADISIQLAEEKLNEEPQIDVRPTVQLTTIRFRGQSRGASHRAASKFSNRALMAMASRGVIDAVSHPASSEPEASPVVIINPDVDGGTGAKTANEVETGSHVVIGG